MSGESFIVPALSWAAIRGKADQVREIVGLSNDPYFPIMDVIEKVFVANIDGFFFLVGSHEEMEGAEGYTSPDGSYIQLREDVYLAACNGNGRARFTAGHEAGHLFLHTNIPLSRPSGTPSVKPYMLSEPQANQFAAELLMPLKFISADDTAVAVARRFGVSREAAEYRLEYLLSRGMI